MTKKKIPLQFRNPCKYCLVKPACHRKCSLLRSHVQFFEITCVIIISIIMISFIGITFRIVYSYTSTHTIGIIIILYIILSYIFLILSHIKDPTELKEMTKAEIVYIILLFPLLILLTTMMSISDNIITRNKFAYRYHPSINPDK